MFFGSSKKRLILLQRVAGYRVPLAPHLARPVLYKLAERAGVEPAIPILSVYALSKRAHSASLTPLQYRYLKIHKDFNVQQEIWRCSVEKFSHTQSHSFPILLFLLAERVGFEPTSRCYARNGFRDRPDQPLWHLSYSCGSNPPDCFGRQGVILSGNFPKKIFVTSTYIHWQEHSAQLPAGG